MGMLLFDSFGVEHIPKDKKTFINRSLPCASQNKNVKANIFRIQAYDSIMCGYFCIGFIYFMLAGKTLTEFTNLFSPNNIKKNGDIILNYFTNNISKMAECDTHNMYPNLNANISHDQQFRLNKSMKLKTILLQRLEKEN